MKLSYLKRALVSAMAVTALSVNAMAAPVYNDVPSTHWAYDVISAVADRGLMVGDTSANFKPNDMIDKFETSKILARSAGYKYENLSAAEKEYYDKCYEKNKGLLAQYSTAFSKWNTSADREISFLLEKAILTAADLNQFVIIKDGKEQLRALSRGEAAMFITKLIGKSSEALADTVPHDFTDDAKISATVKPYVYYLKSINVISGNPDGSFNPDGAVVRAAMATMLARALDLISPSPVTTPSTSTAGGSATIVTVSGTVDEFYSSLNAVQVIPAVGDKEIYKLSATATVYVDGYLKLGSDLQKGMSLVGVLSNGELINIQAQNVTTASTVTPPANIGVQYSAVDGTVATIDQDGTVKTISIEIKTINPRDNSVITDTRVYALAEGCKITRGGNTIQFAEILRGDIVTAQVSGGSVYELALEERVLILKDAQLVDKRYDMLTGQVTFVVADAKEKRYELRLNAATTISRKNIGVTTWDQVRVGDILDLTAEYGILKDLMAYGVLSTADGWIEEINIGAYQSYIMLRDSYGTVKKYYVITGSTDIYSLRVGNKMRLRLDSQEVSTVMLLEEANTNVVTGYVSIIRAGVLVITNTQPYGTNGKRDIELDSATVFTNSKTGENVSYSAIREGQRVYVVFQNALSNLAKTVTILTEN